MNNAERLLKYYVTLSEDEKKEFSRIVRKHWPDYKFDDFENPKTTKNDIKELQERLVQTCIDFLNERELDDVEEVSFSADMLQFSKKYNEWTPMTDSFIDVYGYQDDENGIRVRKKIGDYC